MARVTYTSPATNNFAERQTLWTAGDYLVAIVDARIDSTRNGNTMTDRVYGWEDTTGRGAWVARVVRRISEQCNDQFAPVADAPMQPHQNYDWELQADVAAVTLGAVMHVTVQVEQGSPKSTGGHYPDRNKANWNFATSATPAELASFRKGVGWSGVASRLKASKAAALQLWQHSLMVSLGQAPAADDIDF
jgi:hypothetical protein